MTSRKTGPVPDLMLERYVLGELSPDQHATIAERVAEEPELSARVAAIERSNAEVLQRMPPRVFAAAVSQRAPRRSAVRWSLLAPVLVAAIALLGALPVMSSIQAGPELEVVRPKGDPMLQIHRQGADDPEPLEPGDGATPGDVLQLSYTAAGAEFGAIFSVDGNHTVTRHLPENGHRAVKLQPGAGVPLDHSYELDDAPDYERFVFVTGPDTFDLRAVEKALRGSGDDSDVQLDAPLRTTFFDIRKEAR